MSPHRLSLLEGDVAPHLHRLSIPMFFGMFALSASNIIDTFYISRLGTTALAALGFTMPVVMTFLGFIYGLAVGSTSALARVYGEGDFEKLRRMTTDTLVLTAILTSVVSFLGYLSIDHIFGLMEAPAEMMPLIHHYMAIWYCGMPFVAVMMVGNACIRATGDTRFPAAMMITLSVAIACLDPFLIFGWGPFPELGFTGAAWTMAICYVASCFVSLYCLIFQKQIIMPVIFHDKMTESWKRVLHVGLPATLNNLIAPISFAVIVWIAANLGKEAVAALGVAIRIESLALLVFYAIGAGVSIFTGQNYGAGNYGRIAEIGRIAAKYALLWGGFVAVVLWVFGEMIATRFDSNENVVAYTTQYLHIVPISYAALGILITSNASLNAMGKPLPATILVLLRDFILYIPLALILEAYAGFVGILFSLLLTNMILGVVSFLWNKRLAA